MTNKRSMQVTNGTLVVSGNIGDVSLERPVMAPMKAVPASEARRDAFTGEDFEGALDKVSRPVKGKYADVPYSSEDLIRDKRAEVELEDR